MLWKIHVDLWNISHYDIMYCYVIFFFFFVDGRTDYWREIIDCNVIAPTICSREAYKLMKKHNVSHGHIIQINRWLISNPSHLKILEKKNTYNISLIKLVHLNFPLCRFHSIAGHFYSPLPGNKMYNASKYALKVLTEGLRHELALAGDGHIKATVSQTMS